MYPPDDLKDFFERVRHRYANPTPRDKMNRFKYGARWKQMVKVTPPKNKIPHPHLVSLEKKRLAEKAEALADLTKATCVGCCKCNCRCLCQCGRLDENEPLAMPLEDNPNEGTSK